MGSVLVHTHVVTLCMLLLSLSSILVHGGVPTTLDGPFKPVTVPLDKSFRGNAVDIPDTDPLVQRNVEAFQPEQISLSLSTSHDSVWISWITGTLLHLLPSSLQVLKRSQMNEAIIFLFLLGFVGSRELVTSSLSGTTMNDILGSL